MDIYGKAIAVIENADDEKFGPSGGFTAILSTPSLDRDGDRLDRKEWMEPLADRYPLDVDHGMSVAETVGSFHPYWENDTLMMDAYFSSIPRAQETRTLVTEGHVGSVSVAFMTDKSKKSGEARRELLNAGIVAVPSNRDAIILSAKAAHALREAISHASEDDVVEEAKAVILEALRPPEEPAKGVVVNIIPKLDEAAMANVVAQVRAAQPHASGMGGDRALLQAAHDAMAHLGAVCFPLQSDQEPTGASSGANKAETDETVETKSQTLQMEIPDGVDLEQFNAALSAFFTPTEPPAESPVVETAAASDEEPAPVETAEDAAEDVDPNKRARDMAMSLFASQYTI